MAKVAMTAEIALRIISANVLVTEAGVPYKGIEISNVSYNDADGKPFEWEDGSPYAIVNFKATNQHMLDRAVEQYQDEEFEDAVNNNLSMRMSVEDAQKLGKGITGQLICHNVTLNADTEEETTALLPRKFVPAVAIEAGKIDFAKLLAKKAEGKEAVANNA